MNTQAQTTPTADPQQTAASYFKDLQERICQAFEALEPNGATFDVTPWEKDPDAQLQGSGEMRLMRGEVFEKVGVNFSDVYGTFSPEFAKQIPGALENGGKFRATGVSLVSHMSNPHVPTVHMNVRRIETSQSWYGGGADLTPTFAYDEDTQAFHAAMQQACDGYRDGAYDEYKKWCDEYFHIQHWDEPRGVGGIFFDNVNSNDEDKDFAFVQAVGEAFLTIYPQLVAQRMAQPFTEAEKTTQLYKRGRYVEFNLLYDRGTKFGFATGGNPEAILMSMPPEVRW